LTYKSSRRLIKVDTMLEIKKYFFILLLLPIIAISGCVQQSVLGSGGLELSVKADRSNIYASQNTTLFVDVSNNDERAYWKVFVDVYNTGELGAERIEPKSGVFGSVRVLGPTNCTSSKQCYDEDYGGCGVCINGKCAVSTRVGSAGARCEKTCECTPNSNLGCRDGVCKLMVDSNGNALTCRGGTPYNKCAVDSSGNQFYGEGGTQAYFCDEFGTSYSQCQGMDEIIGTADDCGCPGGKQCRGDGTCGSQVECFATIYNLQQNEVRTLECMIKAPPSYEIPRPVISNDVNVRMRFSNKLSAMQTIEMISEEEYKLREYSGNIQTKPSSYSYQDKVIQLNVEFSKELPIIVRPGEKVYMYLTLKNIGDGIVYPLRPDDFFIMQDGAVVGRCDNTDPPVVLQPDGKTFPKITCELKLPAGIKYISNYQTIINIDYSYEHRKTITVGIVK